MFFTSFTMKTSFVLLASVSIGVGAATWAYIKSDKEEKSKLHATVKTQIRNSRIKLADLIRPEDEKKPGKATSTRKPRAKKTTAKAAKQNVVVVPDFIADKSEETSAGVAS